MSEINYCPICITDFSNEGVKPFKCSHVLCNDCNEQFKNSNLSYKCPLCKSGNKQNLICKSGIDQNPIMLFWSSYHEAVQHNGMTLQYVRNQTEELCKLAVQQIGHALQYVQNQTDEICIMAIQQDVSALIYVQNKTDEICEIAEQQNEYVPLYFTNQEERRIMRVIYGEW